MVLMNASKRVRYINTIVSQNQGGGNKKDGFSRTVGKPLMRLNRITQTKKEKEREIQRNDPIVQGVQSPPVIQYVTQYVVEHYFGVNSNNANVTTTNNAYGYRCWGTTTFFNIPVGFYTVEKFINTINNHICHYYYLNPDGTVRRCHTIRVVVI